MRYENDDAKEWGKFYRMEICLTARGQHLCFLSRGRWVAGGVCFERVTPCTLRACRSGEPPLDLILNCHLYDNGHGDPLTK